MVQNVLTVNDFDSILDNYAGRQVTHIDTTQSTTNISGQESFADAGGVTIKCYFMLTGQNWDFQKAGFIEKGDAVVLAKIADGVKKDDKITADSKTYRIREAFDVPGVFDSTGSGTTMVYTACNLFRES